MAPMMRTLVLVAVVLPGCCCGREAQEKARREREERQIAKIQEKNRGTSRPEQSAKAPPETPEDVLVQDRIVGGIVQRVYAKHGGMPYEVTRSRRDWVKDVGVTFKTDKCSSAFVEGIVASEREAMRDGHVTSVSCLGVSVVLSATARPLGRYRTSDQRLVVRKANRR